MFFLYMENLNKHKETFKLKNFKKLRMEYCYVQMLQLEVWILQT